MTSPPLLNLSSLGRSLDQARQARRFDKQDVSPDAQPRVQPLVQPPLVRQDEAVHELDPESDLGVESARGELRGTAIASVDEIVERPYPLCLLCLARPPSAVLLPCCHLNLCHLCAPLLLHRASASATTSSDSTSNTFRPAQRSTLLPHPLAPPQARGSWGGTAESLSPSSDTIDTPPSPMIVLEDGWGVPILDDAQARETGEISETGETDSIDALRLDLGHGDDSAQAVDRVEAGGSARTLPDRTLGVGLGGATRIPTPGYSVSERYGEQVPFQSQSQSQSQTPAQTHNDAPDPVSVIHADSPRTPWNTLLLRATAGNAKSRRLALGGYVAPAKSFRGGEMDGGDVLPRTSSTSRNQDGPRDHRRDQGILLHLAGNVDDVEDEYGEDSRREQEERLGFSSSWARARVQAVGNESSEAEQTAQTDQTDQSDGSRRVVLSPRPAAGNKHVARCLVCRAGVEGWLRVYTG